MRLLNNGRLQRIEVGTGLVNGLLLVTFVLAQQACGGSEPPPGKRLDATVDSKSNVSLEGGSDVRLDLRADSRVTADGGIPLDAKSMDLASSSDAGNGSTIDSTLLALDATPDVSPDLLADALIRFDAPITPDTGPVSLPDVPVVILPDAMIPVVDAGEDLVPTNADTFINADSMTSADVFELGTDGLANDTSLASFSCVGRVTPDGGVLQQLCYDFSNAASTADFISEGGTWTISDGTYNTSDIPAKETCNGNGTVMSASVLRNLSAQDVRLHARLSSDVSPDKVIVLRSRQGGNRLELNFRSKYTDNDAVQGGDLSIFDVGECTVKTYVDGNTIFIPHEMGQSIVVDIQLIGAQLKVDVDGKQVYNNNLPGVSMTAGSVGFAAFRDGELQFDDLLVDVLK